LRVSPQFSQANGGQSPEGTIIVCLGIPGKVVETYREHDLLMGKVDFSGVSKRVCLEHVPEVQPGEYVLVHVGFALSRIDEDEARHVFEFLDTMNQLDELKAESP
jgi:hydrogenase expression/formation protein HypC